MSSKTKSALIDTHCHLDFPDFENDREEVIKRARGKGVGYIINIGSTLANSRTALELSRKYDFVYATLGCHPHEADKVDEDTVSCLRELAEDKKVVAIGETGLDYYKGYSGVDNQKKLFSSLIDLAKSCRLPLVVHCRQAQDDVLGMLRDKMPLKAVIHCFSGDEKFLKDCLEEGFYVSFTCNITYKKAHILRECARIVPLGRLFLETDAPFLAPEGFRGTRNEPAYVSVLAEYIAGIRQTTVDEIAAATTANAKSFFNIS